HDGGKRQDGVERDAQEAEEPFAAEYHCAPERHGRKRETNGCRNQRYSEREDHWRKGRPRRAARPSGSDQGDECDRNDRTCKCEVCGHEPPGVKIRNIRARSKQEHHQRERRESPETRRSQNAPRHAAPVDGFEVCAQHVHEIVCLHDSPLAIRADSAFIPRCTVTLTAVSDMRVRAAVSATLNPSSFTYRMAARTFGGRRSSK